MLKLIIAWICIMTTGALAQSLSDVEKRAVNELSGEMLECSVYFLVSATCLQGSPDPSTPQIHSSMYRRYSMEEAIALPHRNSNLPRTTNNYKAVLEFHRRLGQLMSLRGALAAPTRSSDVHSSGHSYATSPGSPAERW